MLRTTTRECYSHSHTTLGNKISQGMTETDLVKKDSYSITQNKSLNVNILFILMPKI